MLITIILLTSAFLAMTLACLLAMRELRMLREEAAALRHRRLAPRGPLQSGPCPYCGVTTYLTRDGEPNWRYHSESLCEGLANERDAIVTATPDERPAA